jgi:hypothetical protein
MPRQPEPAAEGVTRAREAFAYLLAIVIPYWLAGPLFRKLLSGCPWATGSYGGDIVSGMAFPWGALFVVAIASTGVFFLDRFARATDIKPIDELKASRLERRPSKGGLMGVIRPLEPEHRPKEPRPSRRFLAAVALTSVSVAALAALAGKLAGSFGCPGA